MYMNIRVYLEFGRKGLNEMKQDSSDRHLSELPTQGRNFRQGLSRTLEHESTESSLIEMILQRHVLLDTRNLILKEILLTPCKLIDRATGRFECIPLRFPPRIGGAKVGIRVSDGWRIQRTDGLQLYTVGASNRRKCKSKRVGVAVEKKN